MSDCTKTHTVTRQVGSEVYQLGVQEAGDKIRNLHNRDVTTK